MRKNLVIGVLILLCFIIQTTIFTTLAPNLLLILTASFALMRGKKNGLVIGFFCGLLIDLFYGSLFGFYALLYMYIGYLNGYFCKIFYDDDVKVPMALIAVSDFGYGVAVYILQFMLRGRLNFPIYLQKVIIPEMVFTVLVTLLIYRLFYRINLHLVDTEVRGRNSNWLRR